MSIVSNRLIIHATNSSSTLNKLCDRRKLIAEELVKIKRARLYNHYVGERTAIMYVLHVSAVLDHHQSTVVQDPDRERLQSSESTCRGDRSLFGETARRLRNGTRVDQDAHASKRGYRILIIDDHTSIRRVSHRSSIVEAHNCSDRTESMTHFLSRGPISPWTSQRWQSERHA